jgi:SAM-dependent methyltransferase
VFDEVPRLYDRVRPSYPDELITDLVSISGIGESSSVLEVGCGTGQATRKLAGLGCAITAVEPGEGMAAVARENLDRFENVQIETSTIESWEDRGRRFDLIAAASSWHWVDPTVGWPLAHRFLHPGGWFAVLANVVVRREGEPEVYAQTADLHERLAPGDGDWGHPPLESEICANKEGWGADIEIPVSCSAPPFCAPTLRSSGSTGRASPTCCARPRSTASWRRRSASRCWMRSPSVSAPRWTTARRGAI